MAGKNSNVVEATRNQETSSNEKLNLAEELRKANLEGNASAELRAAARESFVVHIDEPGRSKVREMPLDPHSLATLGVLARQDAGDLTVIGVSPVYKYDENGERTDERRGMRIKLAAFGGSINAAIEGADEDTFASLPRGSHVRLIDPEARLYPSGHGVGLSVSAAGVELVN